MEVSSCDVGTGIEIEVDTPLDVPFSLLSLELPVALKSMVHTKYLSNGSHFLFVGTESGSLLQVHLENSTYAEVVRDVQIFMNPSQDIAQLVLSNDGEYIYALTGRQLLREPVNPAEVFSINDCRSPSPTPVESPTPMDSMSPTPMDSMSPTPMDSMTSDIEAVESPTPMDSMSPTPMDSMTSDIVIEAAIPSTLAVLAIISVIAIVALIVSCKLHMKAKQKLMNSDVRSYTEMRSKEEEGDEYGPLAESMSLTKSIEKLPPELVIPSNLVQLLDSIGQGEFGIVYKARLNRWHGHGSTEVVAVKTLKGLFTVNDVRIITDEIMKMKHFDHPNVMTLIGVCVSVGGGPAMVMPFMENGSLLNYLRRDRNNITIKDDQDLETLGAVQRFLLNLCLQVAKGMEYLALQNFVHRDLAARNCMIDINEVIKVADFGLAEDMFASGYFRQDKSGSSVKLPFKWMPPESLQEGLFSQKSDVWSFGVTCWEVFSAGLMPYAAVDPLTLIQLLENGRRLEKPSNEACSMEIYSIMESCWKSKPEDRPQFCELVSTISSILESAAGYLELAMSLKETRS